MIMKRDGFVMTIIVLMMTTLEVIACSNCEKVEAQQQEQVNPNPVKEGPHDPVIRGYNRAAVPLIIDPDKVDDYLAERRDTINAYDVVEQMPSFPGGDQKLHEFIKKNLRYPKECADSGIQGRVIVAFVGEEWQTVKHKGGKERKSCFGQRGPSHCQLDAKLDSWQAEWQDGQGENPHTNNFSTKVNVFLFGI